MRHDSIDTSARDAEPRFDLPPRLTGRAERRLAMRATAAWSARRSNENLPPIDSIDLSPDSEFASNTVLIDLRLGDRAVALSIGDAVALTFDIAPGPIMSGVASGLAARLIDACELVRMTESAVPIEGALAGRDSPCLLTRGVVMPLADGDGRLAFAHAVLSWKEVLDAEASAALRREIGRALHAIGNDCRKNRDFEVFG
jgi:hypothetical protein